MAACSSIKQYCNDRLLLYMKVRWPIQIKLSIMNDAILSVYHNKLLTLGFFVLVVADLDKITVTQTQTTRHEMCLLK